MTTLIRKSRHSVLVVGDEVLDRLRISATLEEGGFKVIAVTSVEDALQVLSAVPDIRAVVRDVELSARGKNGFDLAGWVREEQGIGVMAVSGLAAPEDDLSLGVYFLAKPVHGATLVHLVENLIDLDAAPMPAAIRLPERLLPPVDMVTSAPEREPEPVLTPRQRAVLEFLVQGKSNRDIAVALDQAENTVKVHMTAVFKALGVSSRMEALLAGKPLLGRMQNKRDEENAPSSEERREGEIMGHVLLRATSPSAIRWGIPKKTQTVDHCRVPSKTNLEVIRNATERVDQAKHLIQEAHSARRKSEPLVRTIQHEIDSTRRVNDMMGNLAHLIEGMSDGPQGA